MPETLAGFPFYTLSFDRDAEPTDPHEADALQQRLTGADAPAHLIVVSHGWRNDIADARGLYTALFQNVRQQAPDLDAVVAGVFWPSKKFADRDLTPGGAASADADDEVVAALDALDGPDLTDAEREHLDTARALVANLDVEAAQEAFVEHLRAFLPEEDDTFDTPPEEVYHAPGPDLLDRLGDTDDGGDEDGDFDGGAAGIGDLLKKVRDGARNLATFTTYYSMKSRAGDVGEALADVLDGLAQAAPDVEIHLVGHSFGARLVTAAAAATEVARPASMTLLQAAFSHNSFARNFDGSKDGGYRSVLTGGRVRGPIVVTHTRNDKAVGVAYALASRLGRQNANAVGDAGDLFGGLGSNGAQHTPEAQSGVMVSVGSPYPFRAGAVHNLLADAFVSDHNAVTGPECAHALLSAMRTGA